MPMKLLRIFLPAVAAFLLLVVLFAWVDQTALASVNQPDDLRSFDFSQGSNLYLPQSSDLITKVLPVGDNYIHGLIYDNGYLYASTRTFPDYARVLKIDPATLDVITSTTLTYLYDGEDIVAAGNYLWVILYTEPAVLVRVDPATLAWDTAITFTGTLTTRMDDGESLKYAFGALWAGGRNHLARIDISDPLNPTYLLYDFSFLNLKTSSAGLFGSLAHDSQFLWATYKQITETQGLGFYASTIVKMNPLNPAGVFAKTEIPTDTPDDSADTNGAYFVGSEGQPNQTSPSDIYKFSSDPSVYTATKAADSASYGLFVNPAEPQFVWGAYVGSPGIVKKFDLNAAPVLTVTLPAGFDDPSEIAFDPSGNVYITSWQAPAGIVKLAPQYLTSDLQIGASDLPDPVYAGNDITYTLAITNGGPIDTSGVLVTDTLPSQVSFLSSSPASPQCSIHSGNLICAIGNLNAHSSKQVVISARVNEMVSGTITNTAKVTSTTTDPDQQNNTSVQQTMVINSSDLAIQVAADKTRVALDDMLVYSITVSDIGPTKALTVTVQDSLPSGVDFISNSPGTFPCTNQNGTVTCMVGKLERNDHVTLQLSVKVDREAMTSLHNSVSVSASTPDPNTNNNTASTDTSVFHRLFLPVTR